MDSSPSILPLCFVLQLTIQLAVSHIRDTLKQSDVPPSTQRQMTTAGAQPVTLSSWNAKVRDTINAKPQQWTCNKCK